jgi:hypothetical protein
VPVELAALTGKLKLPPLGQRDSSGVNNEHTQALTSPNIPSRLWHDMENEKTDGRSSYPSIADSHGRDSGGNAVQFD